MNKERKVRKEILGEVVGLKNVKTATVKISAVKLHPKYLKPIKKNKKVQAHYEELPLKIKDKVSLINSRPFSATKRFLVVRVISNK